VAAIFNSLDPEEWNVALVESNRSRSAARSQAGSGCGRATELHSAANTLRLGVSWLARSLTPRPIKVWAGFARDAVEQRRTIRSCAVDLMHTQKTGCEESPVAARLADVTAVLGTFHVSPSLDVTRVRSGPTHRVLEWISTRCLRSAIAVSEATKQDWIRRTGIVSERVVTTHNGVDPAKFSRSQVPEAARAQLGLPSDLLILGAVGRLEIAKGFSVLIEALSLLRAEFPQVLVAIAGDGSLRASLQERAQRLAVDDRVSFLGFQTDVNLFLDACDVFVLPSLSEALPFALLEAMSHALPAAGSAVGGVPEVIVPGHTGFLFPPHDVIGLASALRPLLASSSLRRRLGAAGRERIVKYFQEAQMVRKTIDVYRQMIASRDLGRCTRRSITAYRRPEHFS
jgi:glycosyltransferase involved in cell wall biosynthesis